MFCAACLETLEGKDDPQRRRINLIRPLAAFAGFVLAWLCFFALGQALLELPDTFHQGEIWRSEQSGAPDR